MAEQFRVDRPFGDRSTVDSDILSVLPPAILMNNLWKTLLSDTAFSRNQHGQNQVQFLAELPGILSVTYYDKEDEEDGAGFNEANL